MAAPTRAKIRFGKLLSDLRTRAGITRPMAAQEIKIAGSSFARYESGHVLPVWGAVLSLLNLYEATAQDRKIASDLWDRANDEPHSIRLPSSTPKAFRRLVNAEREAPATRYIEMSVIPGLLQTESYTRALMDAGQPLHQPETKIEAVVSTRLARQQRLLGADPVDLHVLMDEAALCREIGGAYVMREQLAYLLVVAARANITLQIIPFTAGAYGPMNGSCIIVDYPLPDEPPGVFLEYPAGGVWVDNQADVQRFTTMFDRAAALALPPAATNDLIHERIKALENP